VVKMQNLVNIFLVAVMMVMGAGCGGGDGGSEEGMGTLEFRMSVSNSRGIASRSTRTCAIKNMKVAIYKIEIAAGEVAAGQPDTLEWQVIRDQPDAVEQLASEITLQAQLPVGTYENWRFTQRNGMYWVVECPQAGSQDLPSLNYSAGTFDEVAPLSVNTPNGSYHYDQDGNFEVAAEGENVSPFEIKEGGKTVVTWIFNFASLDWLDNDESGDWSDGDELDNWTLLPGKDTMFEMQVTYE